MALFITCLLIAITALAQDNSEKKKHVENTQRASGQANVGKSWMPTAFVLNGERLPIHYLGQDPKKFLATFKAKVKAIAKGEYETSEDFAKRTANVDALLAPINTSDLYAFQAETINFKYDADKQSYTIGGRLRGFWCNEMRSRENSREWVTCKLASVRSEADTYKGSNAFGASRTIQRVRGENFALAFPKNSPWSNELFLRDTTIPSMFYFEDMLSVPMEKALRLKNMKLSVVFVGRVTEAKLIAGQTLFRQPTIDAPDDLLITEEAVPFDLKKIIYYVLETGEVLGQKNL